MQKVNQLLKQIAVLQKLDAEQQAALETHFYQVLPPELHSICTIAYFQNGTLKILVEHSAWANRLKYYLPELKNKLKPIALFSGLTKIELAVKKSSRSPQVKATPPTKHFNAENQHLWKNLVEQLKLISSSPPRQLVRFPNYNSLTHLKKLRETLRLWIPSKYATHLQLAYFRGESLGIVTTPTAKNWLATRIPQLLDHLQKQLPTVKITQINLLIPSFSQQKIPQLPPKITPSTQNQQLWQKTIHKLKKGQN